MADELIEGSTEPSESQYGDRDLADDPSFINSFIYPRSAIILFVLTALSTAWAGVTAWAPHQVLYEIWNDESAHVLRRCLLGNWKTGLIFSVSLMTILLLHEFGHYFMMRLYRVPSTLPLFLPFPLTASGTFGALIMMDSSRADRKQIFDIGIAGPLAGLVAAIPLTAMGLLVTDQQPNFARPADLQLGHPLLIYILDFFLDTQATINSAGITVGTTNPYLMAAWIGLLVTGMNMIPLSQLDGGHVIYGVFGRNAIHVARFSFVVILICFFFWMNLILLAMLIVALILGLRHPPSRNPDQKIGIARVILGLLSLALPILCVPATPIISLTN